MAPPWLHPKTKKAAAEDLLQNDGKLPSGRFLIRETATGHILSVGHKNNVVHCKIARDEETGLLKVNDQTYGEKWSSLDEMVDRLSKLPLPKKWPVQLTEAVTPAGMAKKLGKSKKKASTASAKPEPQPRKQDNSKQSRSRTEPESLEPEVVSEPEAPLSSHTNMSVDDAGSTSVLPTQREISTIAISRESLSDGFGFSLGQVWCGWAIKYVTVVTFSRVEGLQQNDQVLGLGVELESGDPDGMEVGNGPSAYAETIEMLRRAHKRCELTVVKMNGIPPQLPSSVAKSAQMSKNNQARLCGRTMWCSCNVCKKKDKSNNKIVSQQNSSFLTLQPVVQA